MKMMLTKQQEKDIKELIELAKQLTDEQCTISIIPGIDFTCHFDSGDLIEWEFVCTNKKNTAIKSIVDLLGMSSCYDVERFINNHPEIVQTEENHKNNYIKFCNLYDKILRRVPNLAEDLLEDTIWNTQDTELLKAKLAKHESKSKNDKIKDLEKELKQIKDPKEKQRLAKILK